MTARVQDYLRYPDPAATRLLVMIIPLLLILLAAVSFADPVGSTQVPKLVDAWLKTEANPLGMPLGRTVKEVRIYGDDKGHAEYYIVYLEPSGFVIVSADDLVEPIIGFARDGTYDPSLDNPLGALVSTDLQARMSEAHSQAESARGIQCVPQGEFLRARQKWSRLLAGEILSATGNGLSSVSDVRVAPLVQSQWNQSNVCGSAVYNYYTPPGPNGSASNYYCGCVATAMAQLMRYYQYPTMSVGTNGFAAYPCVGPKATNYTRGGDGNGGPYDWADMPLVPGCPPTRVQCQAIGALCYDAGVAAHMSYCSNASSSSIQFAVEALSSTFRYSNVAWGHAGVDIGSGLTAMINPSVDAGLPVILGIRCWSPNVGHAILADGYGYNASTMYHHLNMGWGGYSDAWYNLPYISAGGYQFMAVEDCIYNVYPTGSGEIISGRVTDFRGSPIVGATVTATVGGSGTTYGPVSTNSNGIYALTKLPSNTNYIIAAQYSYYMFTPILKSTGLSGYNTDSGNAWAVNFQSQPPAPAGISTAKTRMQNDWVALSDCVVTAAFSDGSYYVEAPNRSCGIRVTGGAQPDLGDLVQIVGTLSVKNSEVQVNASTCTNVGHGSVSPIGLGARALGGGLIGIQPGITGSSGVNNVGLLVRIWGKVTEIGSGCLYIDDGSHYISAGDTPHVGVMVICDPSSRHVGDYLSVTGINSCFITTSGQIMPCILTRGTADIACYIATGHSGDIICLSAGSFLMGTSGYGDDAAFYCSDIRRPAGLASYAASVEEQSARTGHVSVSW